jgi:hypothetical protein
MRTIKHTIRGASLSRIEELDHLGTPDWVPFEKDGLHFSGLLRSCSRFEYIDSGRVQDEDGNMHDLAELLDEAAERLDQAHQEWLEARA